MLQYRKTHNTNDDFEAEGDRQQLILFAIYNDITYEHHVEHIFDIQRIIEHINDFTVHFMDEFIDVKYYSMTFRLNPVGENVQVILKLRNEIAQLKKQIAEHPLFQPIIQQRPPSYLPPNLSLLCEVEYLPWDTLEDLFYMYPLNKKFNTWVDNGYGYYRLGNLPSEIKLGWIVHEIFCPGHTFEFKINFETFNPNDVDLDDYIKANSHLGFKELSRSCKPPFIQNKKINIHILNWITEIFLYYILCWINDNNHKRSSANNYKLPSANIFINQYVCKMQILEQHIPSCQIKFIVGMTELTKFKFRMNFYIDDWSAPPVVVYV